MGHRWERAAGGEVPTAAVTAGHGWEWKDTEDGGQVKEPLWVIRSIAGAPPFGASVRIGQLRRGGPAEIAGQAVEEYEVLCDAGQWKPAKWRDDDGTESLDVPPDAEPCGRSDDGSPLYATIVDGEGNGDWPAEGTARMDFSYARSVLVASVAAGDLRWAPASGGEVPPEACATGHGWEYETPGDSDSPQVPLWVMRTLPQSGEVRLGCVRRGGQATLREWRSQTVVAEYEVLLDAGTWEPMESRYEVEGDDDSGYYAVPAGAVACGRLSDGTPLYASIEQRDDEVGGEIPNETTARAERNWERRVLVDPVAAAAESEAPSVPGASHEQEPAQPVVAWLDCRNEAVAVANIGGAAIDIGGWRLRDDSARTPFVFPNGTRLDPGAAIVVRSGPGAAQPAAGQLAWTTRSVWNDRGDTATLMDASGTVVSTRRD